MPITQGAGNPDWNRDETLLALDLLYRHGVPVYKNHEDVADLSILLQKALIHPVEGRRLSFRNSDGVALKLQNLKAAIEPGRGLSSSALDRELVAEFPKSRAKEVAGLACLIRDAIARGETIESTTDDEDIFTEGYLLTSRHRSRDRRLRKKLLEQTADSELVCAVCQFAPPLIERRLRESFFEAHHIRPLSDTKGVTSTRVLDLALLCAGCHRFLHRLIATRKRWISIPEAKVSLQVRDLDTAKARC